MSARKRKKDKPVELNKELKGLVIDDYAVMRRIVHSLLTNIGFSDIEEAGDADAAMEKLDSGEVDFIISNVNMPRMNAADLLKQLREGEGKKDIPVLMLSGNDEVEQVKDVVDENSAYLLKPFSAELLEEAKDAN